MSELEPKVHHEEEHHLRDWLDSWRLGLLGFLLLATILGIWNIKLTLDVRSFAETNRQVTVDLASVVRRNQQLSAGLAVEQQKRHEAEVAANKNQVQTCFERNAQAPGLQALLEAIRPVVATSQEATSALDNYVALSRENVPSRHSCMTLADKLGIKVP